MTDHTTDPTPIKHCPKCDTDKPATTEHFHRRAASPDGLYHSCKECMKNYYIANKERYAENGRAYYSANKERKAEQGRDWRERNKEWKAERQRVYRSANSGKWTKYRREYNAKNKERYAEQRRAYEASHPDLRRSIKLRYRATKAAAEGDYGVTDIKRQYEAQGGRCAYCSTPLSKGYHIDHVVPLSRGGSNKPDNLVATCPTCNISKRDRLLHTEWIPSNPLPLWRA